MPCTTRALGRASPGWAEALRPDPRLLGQPAPARRAHSARRRTPGRRDHRQRPASHGFRRIVPQPRDGVRGCPVGTRHTALGRGPGRSADGGAAHRWIAADGGGGDTHGLASGRPGARRSVCRCPPAPARATRSLASSRAARPPPRRVDAGRAATGISVARRARRAFRTGLSSPNGSSSRQRNSGGTGSSMTVSPRIQKRAGSPGARRPPPRPRGRPRRRTPQRRRSPMCARRSASSGPRRVPGLRRRNPVSTTAPPEPLARRMGPTSISEPPPLGRSGESLGRPRRKRPRHAGPPNIILPRPSALLERGCTPGGRSGRVPPGRRKDSARRPAQRGKGAPRSAGPAAAP